VSNLGDSLAELYQSWAFSAGEDALPGIDGALRTIFEGRNQPEDDSTAPRLAAAELIRQWERQLMADVFRWTGHFPERTRHLLRHLAERARVLDRVYPADKESQTLIGLTTLVTALAMNHVAQGHYFPTGEPAKAENV
jgi:hypothetical protein